MNGFVKNLGVLVLLIGVVILAIPFITGSLSNALLITGFVTMLIGYFGHILLNKKTE